MGKQVAVRHYHGKVCNVAGRPEATQSGPWCGLEFTARLHPIAPTNRHMWTGMPGGVGEGRLKAAPYPIGAVLSAFSPPRLFGSSESCPIDSLSRLFIPVSLLPVRYGHYLVFILLWPAK